MCVSFHSSHALTRIRPTNPDSYKASVLIRELAFRSSSRKKEVSDSRPRTHVEEERARKTDETEKEKWKWKDLRITGRHGLTCVPCAELWDCAILQIYEIEEGCCCKRTKEKTFREVVTRHSQSLKLKAAAFYGITVIAWSLFKNVANRSWCLIRCLILAGNPKIHCDKLSKKNSSWWLRQEKCWL